jgi:NADPH-dependent ferric siderophore reductase
MEEVRRRRPPAPFRRLKVSGTEALSPRLQRVTLAGPALEGLVIGQPAASVRVLLPSDDGGLVIPGWTGNQFQYPDGGRPILRTLTPRRLDPTRLELDVWVVIHGTGAASEWAKRAQPGDEVAVSGPARGYSIDPEASLYFLAGDETAVPAISQLMEQLPPDAAVAVHIDASPDARMALPPRPDATVTWADRPTAAVPGQTLVAAFQEADLRPGTRVWVAGEAAAVQRVRRHLFEARNLPRAHATVRGYWKHGRSGEQEGE